MALQAEVEGVKREMAFSAMVEGVLRELAGSGLYSRMATGTVSTMELYTKSLTLDFKPEVYVFYSSGKYIICSGGDTADYYSTSSKKGTISGLFVANGDGSYTASLSSGVQNDFGFVSFTYFAIG